MAKKGEARENITLVCSDCKSENYRTEKKKRNLLLDYGHLLSFLLE